VVSNIISISINLTDRRQAIVAVKQLFEAGVPRSGHKVRAPEDREAFVRGCPILAARVFEVEGIHQHPACAG
jgi:hypothetical protein